MKKFWKIPTFVVLSSLLLFSPMGTVFAGDKTPPPDPNAFITIKTTTSMPIPGSNEQPDGGISPDSVSGAPIPGGGTAYAEIGVMYNSSSLKGYGQSSISSDALGFYQLCAQVNWLKRNGTQVAQASQTCSTIPQTGGASWLRQTGLVSGSPYGKTWSDETYHQVNQYFTGWSWKPTLTFSVTL